MAEQKIDELKISEEEANAVRISNSADRPNAFNSYRESKKTAADVKKMFDAPFELLRGKHDKTVDELRKYNAAESEREAAETAREVAETKRANAEQERKTAEITRDEKIDKIYEDYESGQLKGEKGDKGDPGSVNVVQTPGDSETDAMSQKAVTKVIESINKGMGAKTVVSKNLFNPNSPDWLIGYKMNIAGVISEDSSRILSNFIPVESGEQVIYSHLFIPSGQRQVFSGDDWYYLFDSNKTFIGHTTVPSHVFTVPEGVAYIRYAIFSYQMSTDYMLENGTEITDYEPYFEPYTEYKIPKKTSELENDAGFISERSVSKPLALPPTIYGFVGVPMSLYHYNIMDYNPNDVYIRMITTAKGVGKAKKWEWTPDAAANFSIYYNIFNHDYDVLNNREKFQVVIKESTEKTSLKVLVLGDSTVFHGYETQKMLNLATADNYDLTLLGTRGATGSLNQHEGRGGWTAAMYVNNASNPSGSVVNAFYNPNTSTFDFSYYMTQQGYSDVDCVFIQLGINDVFSATTEDDLETAQNTFYTNLDKMIASIHEYDSNIKIVLNTVIPSDTDQDAFSEYYPIAPTVWINHHNVYSTNRKTIERYANRENIYVSWYGAMIDVDNNMQGDVHPNPDGYAELGTQMYSFMRAIN